MGSMLSHETILDANPILQDLENWRTDARSLWSHFEFPLSKAKNFLAYPLLP